MKEIQKACGRLSQHDDMNVVVLAGKIIAADKVQERYIADLKAEIANQAETIAALQSEEAFLRELVGKLENNLKSLQATFFGQKSEKSSYDGSDDSEVPDEGDADPFDEDDAEEKEEGAIKPEQPQKEKGNGTKRSKVRHPANIRIETKIIEPDQSDFCDCGCAQRTLKPEIRKRLCYKPAEYYQLQEHYPKYCCKNCGKFTQSKTPDRVFEQTATDKSVIANILTSHFADFLPLYRIEQIMLRSGITMSVNGGAKTGHGAEQKSATLDAGMRPAGGRSPSGGLIPALRFSEGFQPAFRARLWARR